MHTNEDPRIETAGYEAPALTMRGTAADVTQAFLAGVFVDSNFAQGDLILGHTSL